MDDCLITELKDEKWVSIEQSGNFVSVVGFLCCCCSGVVVVVLLVSCVVAVVLL